MDMSSHSLTAEQAVRALGRLLIGSTEESFDKIIEQDLTPHTLINFISLTNDPMRQEIYYLIQARYGFEASNESDPLLMKGKKTNRC